MNVISVRKSNLSEVCRVCLSPSNEPYTNIFSSGRANLEAATIAAAVMECAPVHIVQGDGLPNLICNSCNSNLEISHQFRTLCVRSESILQRYIAQLNLAATNLENQQHQQSQTTATTTITQQTFISTGDSEKETENGQQQQHQQQHQQQQHQQQQHQQQQQQHQQQVSIIDKSELDNSDNSAIYIKEEDCNMDENVTTVQQIQTYHHQQQQSDVNKQPMENTIIKEITTAQIEIKPPSEFSAVTTATVLKQEIITDANELKMKLENTDGNCYQLQGAIESFSTDQTQEIQYRFFNPIVENTDGQIIKVNNIEKANSVSNTTNTTIPEQNFESYLVKLFTKEEDRPHKCNVCLKTFKRSSNLSEHAKVHSECRPYKCEVCQKWFKRSCDLAEHKRSHSNERPFKCTLCPKSFKRNCDLSEHMKIHTNERPFECDICHKGFKRNGQFLEHRRIHTGEKPYECEVCHHHFRTSSKLSAHSRVHNEERNHKCTLCPKSFRSYKSLTIHSRVHLDN